MTEREMLIDKAKKIAARMESPYENEVAIAAKKLKKLMDEHNLKMSDVKPGTSKINDKQTASAGLDEGIVTVIYKSYYEHFWVQLLINKVAHAYECDVVFRGSQAHIMGFYTDVEITKFVLVYLRRYIEDKIAKYGYTKEEELTGYAHGVMTRVLSEVKKDSDTRLTSKSRAIMVVKSNQVEAYINRNYNTDRNLEGANGSTNTYDKGLRDGSRLNIPNVIGRNR